MRSHFENKSVLPTKRPSGSSSSRICSASAKGSVCSRGERNAMCESFVATHECGLLGRHRYCTQADARLSVFPLHRRLVQSAPQTFGSRSDLAGDLRDEASAREAVA